MTNDGIGNYTLFQSYLLLLYYVLRWPSILPVSNNKKMLRPSTLFNRTNIIHMTTPVTKIKYIMYNVQDYSRLYTNAVRLAMRGLTLY